jgi:hypothetical protein
MLLYIQFNIIIKEKDVYLSNYTQLNRCLTFNTHIVVVAVKERKSNCNVNEKEVNKILAKCKSCKYT